MSPNPLRDPRDRRLPRIAGPCTIVLFGVTGDLARKKLIPAIYDLANRGLLPPGFGLVGFARRDWGDGTYKSSELVSSLTTYLMLLALPTSGTRPLGLDNPTPCLVPWRHDNCPDWTQK